MPRTSNSSRQQYLKCYSARMLCSRSRIEQQWYASGSSKSVVPEKSDDEIRLAAYEEQIVLVQEWTVEWDKELKQRWWSHPDFATNRFSKLEFPNRAQPVGHWPERPDPGSVIVDPQLLNLSPTANESSLHTPNHSLLQGHTTAQRLDAPQYPLPVILRNGDQQHRDDGVTQQNPYPYLRNSRFPWERSASSTRHKSGHLPSSGMLASLNCIKVRALRISLYLPLFLTPRLTRQPLSRRWNTLSRPFLKVIICQAVTGTTTDEKVTIDCDGVVCEQKWRLEQLNVALAIRIHVQREKVWAHILIETSTATQR
jgi:hypothetical protein